MGISRHNINADVVYPQLAKTINDIVHPADGSQGVDAERLLWQVRYYTVHGGRLRYPGGMYYALQDRAAAEAYRKHRAAEAIKKQGPTSYTIAGDPNLSATPAPAPVYRQPSFADILGG